MDSIDRVLGMLYIVDVRMVNRASKEKVKQRLLLVGCERDDVERKLRWIYDATQWMEFSVVAVEKVREKTHIISTVITQDAPPNSPVIERDERSEVVSQAPKIERAKDYEPRLFAIGVSTTMVAQDANHAIRKTGAALSSSTLDVASYSGPRLSDDATVTVEEIPFRSGYATPRDQSNSATRAHIFRS